MSGCCGIAVGVLKCLAFVAASWTSLLILLSTCIQHPPFWDRITLPVKIDEFVKPPPYHLNWCKGVTYGGEPAKDCNPPALSSSDKQYHGFAHQCIPFRARREDNVKENWIKKRASIDTGIYVLNSCVAAFPLDIYAAAAMARIMTSTGVASVLELGAGCGCYTHFFRHNFGLNVSAYDGIPSISLLSNGLVARADLTDPPDFGMHDWVICTEVGEHIPKKWQDTLIRTVTKHARKGIMFSWDNTPSPAHVNPQPMHKIVAEMAKHRWKLSNSETKYLKGQAGRFCCPWLASNLMVYRPLDHNDLDHSDL